MTGREVYELLVTRAEQPERLVELLGVDLDTEFIPVPLAALERLEEDLMLIVQDHFSGMLEDRVIAMRSYARVCNRIETDQEERLSLADTLREEKWR